MNSFLEGVLSRPRTILTLMLFLLAAGAYVYVTIPKEANPDIDVPVFYVSVSQPGISAEDAERLLVKPMEQELRTLDGLKEIQAIASESHAGIVLEFEADFDKDEALADVRDRVDAAKAELPEEAEEPTITETNFSLVPTIVVALSGDVPERTLYKHAQRLQDRIEAVPSVLSADLSGAREEQLEVVIDRTLMESYNLNPIELLQALERNNALVPAGFLDTGEGRFSVKVPGLIEDRQDVYSMVVKERAENVVTVGDIAEVRRTFKDPTKFTRVNGRPAITIDVVKRLGENIIENNQAVRAAVAEATADWPEPVKVDFLLDQSSFIYEVLGGLEASISTAIVLVMIVVVAALGLRSALLVGVAIPTSILLGFVVLSGLGMTVNMMVMFGLVLTVGLLVDGAIVIVEYADRRVAEGVPRPEAFKQAAKLMVWPLTSSTATTLIAFLPLLLWPGVPGEFMSYLPIMVIIVLSVALVTAMIFLPVVGSVLSESVIVGLFAGLAAAGAALAALQGVGAVQYAAAALAFLAGTLIAWALARRWGGNRAVPAGQSIPQNFDPSAVRGATGVYVRALKRVAGSTAGIALTMVFVVGVAFAILSTFMQNNNGVEFFVEEEPDVAVVMVSARGNMGARKALDLVADVEREILAVDGVADVVTRAFPSGEGGGSGGIGMNTGDKPADIIGEMQIELVDYCCRRPAADIFADVRERTDFAGIKTQVRKVEGGPPTGKDIQLQITSDDYETLLGVTGVAREHFETVEGLRDIEDDRPLPGIEWQLMVDREEAGRFGADIQTVGQIIQLVTNGVLLSKYQPDDTDEQIDIRVRYPEAERTLDQFGDLRLQTQKGLVPVANFIDITPQQRVSSITRIDGAYAMTVKADVLQEAGYDLNAKIAELDAWIDSRSWPENIAFQFRGANEEQAESFSFLMKAMIASLVLMFLVLVTQFNSFYQTALTLTTIVLSVFGVLLGMLITGQKFSVIMTGTGVIALAGIVVNNAIVLIDTYNRERRRQPDHLTAVLATSAQRIRPILLTTITTIAGLIPMATQVNLDFFTRTIAVGGITSVWWVQLSTAIISGLAFSTILTLLVVPVMLAMPETVSRTVARLRGRPAPQPAPEPPEAPWREPVPLPLPAAAAARTQETPATLVRFEPVVTAALQTGPSGTAARADTESLPDVYAPVAARAQAGDPPLPARDDGTEPARPASSGADSRESEPGAHPAAESAGAVYGPVIARARPAASGDTDDGAASRAADHTAEAGEDRGEPDVYAPVLARHRVGEDAPQERKRGEDEGGSVPQAAE